MAEEDEEKGEKAKERLSHWLDIAQWRKQKPPNPNRKPSTVVVVIVARKSSLRTLLHRTLLSAHLIPGLIQPQLDVDRDECRYLPAKHINLGNRRQET